MKVFLTVALLVAGFSGSTAFAGTIVDDLATSEGAATCPELKSVTVDLKTTALLLLFQWPRRGNQRSLSNRCDKDTRCFAENPKLRQLLDKRAR